jgi:hypothetical protein
MLRGRKGACSDLKDKKGISRIDFSIGPGFFFGCPEGLLMALKIRTGKRLWMNNQKMAVN